jgi:hypothetical protein
MIVMILRQPHSEGCTDQTEAAAQDMKQFWDD